MDGGNRNRIISWLFSEKNRQKGKAPESNEKTEEHSEKNEIEKEPEETINVVEQPSEKEPQSDVEQVNETIETTEVQPSKKTDEQKKDKDESKEIVNEVVIDNDNRNLVDQEIEHSDELQEESNDAEIESPPTIFIDEEIVEEIKEQNHKKETNDEIEENVEQEKDNDTTNNIFPEISEVVIDEETTIADNVEKPELLQVAIIEEIDNLILNDSYDLKDIKYKIEVLMAQEKDEVLLENIEKIQKQLEILIKEFKEIKKKYDYAYTTISIKDISMINDLDMSIEECINNIKENSDNNINQFYEVERFIDIVNGIIEIEKQKDILQESIDDKLIDYSIRDEDFINLQDQYADVEAINDNISKYNIEIAGIIKNINEKLDNSVEISKRIEQTTSIVPDINKMIQSTILMASTKMIPPTPTGNIFRTSLFIEAAHMMATAFTPKTEEKEIIHTEVTDYSRDILNNKEDITKAIDSIDNAFSEIEYMKDTFEKEFSQYKNQIPEYDKLIKNIFAIEKELERQQNIAYDYSSKFDYALKENNKKVKLLENDNV